MSKTIPKCSVKLMNYVQPTLRNLAYSQECRIIGSRQSQRKTKSNKLSLTARERFISPIKSSEPDIEYIKPNTAKPIVPYVSLLDENLIKLKPTVFSLHETSNIKVNEAINSIIHYNQYLRKPRRNYKECFKPSMSELKLKQLKIEPANKDLIEKLISKHPYDKEVSKIFLKACKAGDEVSVTKILDENKYIINCYDYTGMTGLHWATIRNHIKIVHILLRYKTIVDAVDFVISTQLHRTSLFIAVQYGNDEIMHTLLKHGSSPLIESYNKKLPITVARSDDARKTLKSYTKVSVK